MTHLKDVEHILFPPATEAKLLNKKLHTALKSSKVIIQFNE